ncbi:MAG TPA: M23 family metallopeptidase [Propionibacteriaceae bacterium]|nr:M23 family metallopeptidase [Propionibacteriaceae bacterium]
MAFQPTKRITRVVTAADEESAERRGWLSHGLAALGISALGLAVAASVALTTSAQTNDVTDAPADLPVVAAPAEAGPAPVTKQSQRQAAALAAYARRDAAVERTSRSAALEVAIVKEQAAQRAEELAKSADAITQAARAATSEARQEKLTAADRASRQAAAQLAQEKVRRAVAARVAAAGNREAAESQPTTPEVTDIPSGGIGVSPVPGAVIGAHFGQYGMWSRYHTGLDFRAGHGTPIRAVKAGVVLFAGNSGDWAGNHVAVRHADGKTTMSSHMSSMAVRSGQSVQAGQVIGYVGQTGRAFGAHLHFELYPAGVKYGDVYRAINPVPWLSANGVHTR